ncbi:MAG: hypothetical protein Q8916_03975 [Bacteroidota bacterium]|nr:hypothetical protein [Bacteroidota bacterium]MDP4229546.1 hypothetical protein [Bacteroidota bacterium]MDP4235117.1 hypothetical protein [Bacteroidota bacterium]
MSLEIAKEFASMIDTGRYDEATQLLSDSCEYTYSEGKYQGRENIIFIYRMNDRESKKLFDEVSYASEVEPTDDGKFRINFVDSLRKGRSWHKVRSFQVLQIEEGQIASIHHYEIPGEIESLRAFYGRATAEMNIS